jgi:hypothetical protein
MQLILPIVLGKVDRLEKLSSTVNPLVLPTGSNLPQSSNPQMRKSGCWFAFAMVNQRCWLTIAYDHTRVRFTNG